MIERVHVRNFQSLHDVDVELGPLTVIVGPSSSGKSAFMRALRTLTGNRRGNEFISHGERVASITAHTDAGVITLTRGRSTSPNDNNYTVTPNDPAHPLYPERIFSKLGGDTPPEVSSFLGIEAKDPINYAGQFDKPYLLDTGAGEVARTLGALTNVNVIFEAARESNRRKLSAAANLRTRQEDLAAIRQKIPAYRALKAQTQAIELAERHIEKCRELERQIARLTQAMEQLTTAERAISALEPIAAEHVPDPQPILDAAAKLAALRDALREQQAANKNLHAATAAHTVAEQELTEQQEIYRALVSQISDDLHGWFTATADPSRMHTEELTPTEGPAQITTWIDLDEAIRVFTQYIETKATA